MLISTGSPLHAPARCKSHQTSTSVFEELILQSACGLEKGKLCRRNRVFKPGDRLHPLSWRIDRNSGKVRIGQGVFWRCAGLSPCRSSQTLHAKEQNGANSCHHRA